MTDNNVAEISMRWSSSSIASQAKLIKKFKKKYSVKNRYVWFQFLKNEFNRYSCNSVSQKRITLTEEELFLEEMEQALIYVSRTDSLNC